MVSQRTGSWAAWIPTLEYPKFPFQPASQPKDARAGQPPDRRQGAVWFRTDPTIVGCSTTINTGKFTAYDWPKDNHADAAAIDARSPDGSIWETAGNQVRMLNTAMKEFSS